MQTVLTWGGRIALAAVFAVAFSGAISPVHDASVNALPGDVVEHVAFGYLLTLLTILSAPRISPWLAGGVYLAMGIGLEVSQLFGMIAGTFQWKDLVSNLAGVVAALAPIAVARRKAA